MKVKNLLFDQRKMQKIGEQVEKDKVIDENPTEKYTNEIQKHLCKLRKENN